ncbi:NARE ribosyltransferase, partial [Zapornia atra]|nr:NARE ribosyltransferase [Zapornia atra]
MEHLALGLVQLLGMLASVSPMFQKVPIMEMDMAPNSFDDQYKGCSDKMEKELKELNRTEFYTNKMYAEAWIKANAKWQSRKSQSSVLKREQAIALMAYTVDRPLLYKEFNAAVREAGRSPEEYLLNFHFKVLHFLLTEALRALWDAQSRRCHNVYRGVGGIIFTAQRGQSVRFGQFASSSQDKKRAKKFGTDTFFSVKTCYGVPIRKFSFFNKEKEVLIPPFEIFEVISVTHEGNSARIKLRSKDVYSKYNCEFLKEKQCKNQTCDFSAGQSVSRYPLWGFLLTAKA